MFNSIQGFHSLDASSTSPNIPTCDNQKCWQILPDVPWWAKSPKVYGMISHKTYKKSLLFPFLKRLYLFIFRQKGKKREREGEKHQCVVASHVPPTGDLACNPGIWSDSVSNRQPFGLQASAQSTEPHQPGREVILVF